jgi:FeS assembly SUF system regulator
MLRMSKLTDYGTLVLAQLAVDSGRLSSAGDVAEATRLSRATVSKLLKKLAGAGLVTSERGAHGGYALARAPERISAAAILDALEGPVSITECSALDGACDLERHCRLALAWQTINRSIRQALQDVSLADLRALPQPLTPPPLKRSLGARTATAR